MRRKKFRRQTAVILGLLCLLIALWPPAFNLYELTGEETLPAQIRGLVHWGLTALRPQPRLASHAAIVHHPVSPFGVNTFLEQEVEISKRETSMRLIQEAGFAFIRQEFVWEDIEIHGKGDFEDRRHEPFRSAWEKYDNIVALAGKYEIEIIARLSNPPAWTRAEPVEVTGSKAPPDDFTDFVDFATAVASRYRNQIRYYQIWNEPNGNEEWGQHQPVDPQAYTELLCAGYAAIKAADPDAVVLAGALTPTVAITGANFNDLMFLEQMYAAGAGRCFDIMSAQGYGLFSGGTDQRLRPTVINYPHHLYLRDIMVRHGDEAKPIWISEMGWTAIPDGLAPIYGRVNEAQQARYTVDAYRRAQNDWPWVGVINYWFLKRAADWEWEREQSWIYFRLFKPDFTPLPVYQALSAYANDNFAVAQSGSWKWDWMRLRPYFFFFGSGVLFFALLNWINQPAAKRA